MNRLETALEAARIAGKWLMNHSAGPVQLKSGKDIVTQADIQSQEIITQFITSRFPNDLIVSEENTLQPEGDFWVLDPLDGTVNYASSLPFWSVSVAYFKQNQPYCGAVYIPVLDEMYWADINSPGYCNKQVISPSSKQNISEALVSVVLPSRFNVQEIQYVSKHIAGIASMVRGVRVLVSEAIELCYVACGRLDGNYCPSKGFFSAAAASLIARQAGCIVTDTLGQPYRPGISKDILAGNPFVHQELLGYFLINN